MRRVGLGAALAPPFPEMASAGPVLALRRSWSSLGNVF